MKLNDYERTSALWQKISIEITERLTTCREKNDSALDSEATATLRGTIRAFKEVMAWADVDPDIDI